MTNGARPTLIDHKDFDLLKSNNFRGIEMPIFPEEYFADAGLTMPDQTKEGQPAGCTNYTSAELSTDLDSVVKNPADLEKVTHANARGGYDIRLSLLAAIQLKWIAAFFNIKAYYPLDYFDAFRYAQICGIAEGEKRSISWGTPWFPSWEAAINGMVIKREADGSYTTIGGRPKGVVMSMPLPEEIVAITSNINAYGWHDSKLDGWTAKHGPLCYRDKSWQGPNIGEGGFIFFPREVINVVMSITGTVAFTGTNIKPVNPARIDTTLLQKALSILRKFLWLRY